MENTQAAVTLMLGQWNAVIQGLAHRPYSEVFHLIEEIRKQAEAAIKPQVSEDKVD